jgi:hypothetical protein
MAASVAGTVTAKPTRYNGIHFRSRLEARWAVFWECLGLECRYEYEKFNVDGRGYIPDFFLPSVAGPPYPFPHTKARIPLGCWVEVKGDIPDEDAVRKLKVVHYGEFRAAFAIGDIRSLRFYSPHGGVQGWTVHGVHWFLQCPWCGRFGVHNMHFFCDCDWVRQLIVEDGMSCRDIADCVGNIETRAQDGRLTGIAPMAPSPAIAAALDAALSVRFEDSVYVDDLVASTKKTVAGYQAQRRYAADNTLSLIQGFRATIHSRKLFLSKVLNLFEFPTAIVGGGAYSGLAKSIGKIISDNMDVLQTEHPEVVDSVKDYWWMFD